MEGPLMRSMLEWDDTALDQQQLLDELGLIQSAHAAIVGERGGRGWKWVRGGGGGGGHNVMPCRLCR